MTFVVLSAAFIYGLSFFCSPFMIWSTYFSLWKNVIKGHAGIPLKLRAHHAMILTRYVLLTPLWTALWYLDDVLYSKYSKKIFDKVYVILGQPRSGTTFFQRTLAKDEDNFLVLKHMEWRFPYICVHKFLSWSGLDKKIAKINYWPNNKDGEIAGKMHKNVLGDFEEDGIFFEERFLHHYFVFRRFPYPNLMADTDYFDALTPADERKILKTHNKVLQKIFYLRGKEGQAPLLKENEAAKFMALLNKQYKNVSYIPLLRDPENSLPSYEALSKQSTLAKTGINPEGIDGWYEANMEKRSREFLEQQNVLSKDIPAEQQVSMSFEMLTTRMVEAYRYFYMRLNLRMSKNFRAYLDQCEAMQKTRQRGYSLPKSKILHNDEYKSFKKFVVSSTENAPKAVND